MSTTLSPSAFHERTTDQRLLALAMANQTRARRAALKRDLKAGRRSAVSLLADPPDWLATMKVIDLLLSVPKWGRVKSGAILRQNGISPSKTVGGLAPRQRAELVRALGGVPCQR